MTKIMTPQQLEGITDIIITEKQKLSELQKIPFVGVTRDEVFSELNKRISADYVLTKEQPFKLTKEDINAVANSRFYRKTGMKLLMAVVIIILFLLLMTNLFHVIPSFVYIGLITIVGLGFITIYGRKQQQAKRDLWKTVPGGNLDDSGR